MNTHLVHAQPKTLLPRSPFSRILVRQIRALLRTLGILVYHLGLAPCVISLSPGRVRTFL